MSDEKSVEAAIMDGDIGPHTCRSCCAPTWNDWEVCDECENEASDLSDADELASLRAEVERLKWDRDVWREKMDHALQCERNARAALADERAHADALAGALEEIRESFSEVANQWGDPFEDECATWAKYVSAAIGELHSAIVKAQHRARRQG